MAFSTSELEYAKSFVNKMYDEGYKYYICYTNTVINSGYYTSAEPDLFIIFSKDKITGTTSYNYNIPSGSLMYSIRCSDYSTSSYAVNSDRVVVSDYSSTNLLIDVYEHIFTNAEFSSYSLQPDVRFDEGGAEIEKTNSLGLVVTLALLFVVIFTVLRFK